MSIKDEYREVLQELASQMIESDTSDFDTKQVMSQDEQIINDALDQLLAINKRRVPEFKRPRTFYETALESGFNQCRAEVMRELT